MKQILLLFVAIILQATSVLCRYDLFTIAEKLHVPGESKVISAPQDKNISVQSYGIGFWYQFKPASSANGLISKSYKVLQVRKKPPLGSNEREEYLSCVLDYIPSNGTYQINTTFARSYKESEESFKTVQLNVVPAKVVRPSAWFFQFVTFNAFINEVSGNPSASYVVYNHRYVLVTGNEDISMKAMNKLNFITAGINATQLEFEFGPGDAAGTHFYMDVRFYTDISDINTKTYPWLRQLRTREEFLLSFLPGDVLGSTLQPMSSQKALSFAFDGSQGTTNLFNFFTTSVNLLSPRALVANSSFTLSWSYGFSFWFKFSRALLRNLKDLLTSKAIPRPEVTVFWLKYEKNSTLCFEFLIDFQKTGFQFKFNDGATSAHVPFEFFFDDGWRHFAATVTSHPHKSQLETLVMVTEQGFPSITSKTINASLNLLNQGIFGTAGTVPTTSDELVTFSLGSNRKDKGPSSDGLDISGFLFLSQGSIISALCEPGCRICTGLAEENRRCLLCDFGLVLSEGKCQKSCPAGQRRGAGSSFRICYPAASLPACPAPCHECQQDDASKCFTCKEGYVRATLKELYSPCVARCPDGKYNDRNISCADCSPSCQTCQGPSYSQCLKCSAGSNHLSYSPGYLENSTTVKSELSTCYTPFEQGPNPSMRLECPIESAWFNASLKGCYKSDDCDPTLNCRRCASYSKCTSCIANHYLSASKCLSCRENPGFWNSKDLATAGVPESVASRVKAGECVEICGDGKIFVAECDDNNTVSGDGCSAECKVEPGYTCYGPPPSTCRIQQYPTLTVSLREEYPERIYFRFSQDVRPMPTDNLTLLFKQLEIRNEKNVAMDQEAYTMEFIRVNSSTYYLAVQTSRSLIDKVLKASMDHRQFVSASSFLALHPSYADFERPLNQIIKYGDTDRMIMLGLTIFFFVILAMIAVLFALLVPSKKTGILWILVDYLQILGLMGYLKITPLLPFEHVFHLASMFNFDLTILRKALKTNKSVRMFPLLFTDFTAEQLADEQIPLIADRQLNALSKTPLFLENSAINLAVILLVTVVLLVAMSFESKTHPRLRRVQNFLKYQGFLGAIFFSYYQLSCSAWIQLHYGKLLTSLSVVSFASAVAALLGMFLLPLLLGRFLDTNEDDMLDSEFLQAWGTIYSRVKFNEPINRHFLLQTTLMKLVQTFVLINLSNSPLDCLLWLFIVANITLVQVYVMQPFADPAENEQMGRAQLSLIILYMLMVINEAVRKSGLQGWYSITVTFTTVSVGIIILTIFYLLVNTIIARKTVLAEMLKKIKGNPAMNSGLKTGLAASLIELEEKSEGVEGDRQEEEKTSDPAKSDQKQPDQK